MYQCLQVSVSEEDTESKKRAILHDHARIAWDRVLVVDGHWRLGLTHASAREGDLICIIHGSKIPLILRCLDDGKYCLVGQCYLEGVMRGEVHTWQEAEADVFVLV